MSFYKHAHPPRPHSGFAIRQNQACKTFHDDLCEIFCSSAFGPPSSAYGIQHQLFFGSLPLSLLPTPLPPLSLPTFLPPCSHILIVIVFSVFSILNPTQYQNTARTQPIAVTSAEESKAEPEQKKESVEFKRKTPPVLSYHYYYYYYYQYHYHYHYPDHYHYYYFWCHY